MERTCMIVLFFLGISLISHKACGHTPKPATPEPPFSYADPSKWGSIAPGYKLCSTGSQQSPIDIDSKKLVHQKNSANNLTVDYQISSATLSTNGLVVQVSVKGKTEADIEGKVHRLLNLRWHTPSEHHIDGVRYDAEMHQVFVANNGGGSIFIIATLYKHDAKNTADPIVKALQGEMTKLKQTFSKSNGAQVLSEEEVSTKEFSSELLKKLPSDKYFLYHGSLTSPPCTEQVIWLVHPQVQPMSKEQVSSLQDLLSASSKNNARPTQPINTRQVFSI